MALGFRIAMAGGFCQETGMKPQAPPVGEQETKPRWWTIGYRLFSLLVLVLLAWSFIGTPEDRTVTVLESSALSEPDLIEAGMAIQSELAKGAPAVPDIFKTEGWQTLQRAVAEHRDHFQAIDQERRWWNRLHLWAMVAAFVGLMFFGKLQEREEDQRWDETLPKGRKHLWGKVPR